MNVIAIILITLLLIEESVFRWNKYQILNNPTQAQQQINHRLMIGFRDFEELEQLSNNGVAGVFITMRNLHGMSIDEIKPSFEKIQDQRKQAGLNPLLIATDQEGGPVSRLSPLLEQQPPLSSFVGVDNAIQKAYDYGLKQGKFLKDLGVNINFSPVIDLKPAQDSGFLDFHTLIHSRAISELPEQVSKIALPYIKGLESQGITATLKHFPGLGSVQSDTHHFSTQLNIPVRTLSNHDWIPYKTLTQKTNAWIMLAHVILSEIDSDDPVSTSSIVVKKIIRDQLNYDGILVTDDLTMGATYSRGFCKSIRHAFASDINYLLIAYDYEKYYDAMMCLKTVKAQEV